MDIVRQPINFGKLELHNRIVMPPIATYQNTEDGYVTQKMLDYYGERAKGGNISMIITEHSYITLQGKAKAKQLSIADDACIDGLKKLTDAIHQNGTKAMAQINHAGSAAPSAVNGGRVVSASGVILPTKPMMGDGTVPEELTKEEIAEIEYLFGQAARRAKEAGYDAVEIHSAHAYLLNQFYSPLTNKRTDEYGGSLENRLRVHREVIREVRKQVGRDFPISVRLGGCDYCAGGSTIEDSVFACKVFENESVDMVDISGGMCRYTHPTSNKAGYFSDMSEEIKKSAGVPVMLTGGVQTAAQAEKLLENNSADLIGIGRELLKNPHWADEQLRA